MFMHRWICALLFPLLACSNAAWCQEGLSWKVILNKKVVLRSSHEDDTVGNRLQIKKSELDNNGLFKIEVTDSLEKKSKTGWVRSLALVAPDQTSIAQKDSASQLYFYNRDLLKMIWVRKKITAYTWTSPPDPAMAALIRIRRIRLFTLEFAEE
jgi:DUF2075 family protein